MYNENGIIRELDILLSCVWLLCCIGTPNVMSTDPHWVKGIVAVAVGIGITVGSVGVVFVTQLLEKKEKLLLKQEVDELNVAIIELQAELKALK